MASPRRRAVAHRLSTVVNADLIGVMVGGRLVEQGAHRELIVSASCGHAVHSGGAGLPVRGSLRPHWSGGHSESVQPSM
ncbi:MAG TPA: hypothetical protein VGF17_09485 [Phytomonospora sp.]